MALVCFALEVQKKTCIRYVCLFVWVSDVVLFQTFPDLRCRLEITIDLLFVLLEWVPCRWSTPCRRSAAAMRRILGGAASGGGGGGKSGGDGNDASSSSSSPSFASLAAAGAEHLSRRRALAELAQGQERATPIPGHEMAYRCARTHGEWPPPLACPRQRPWPQPRAGPATAIDGAAQGAVPHDY